MSIRKKAIFTMMLLVLSICVAFLFLIYQQNNLSLKQRIANEENASRFLAETTLTHIQQNYQRRIKSFLNYRNIRTRELILQAFAARDREQLLRLSRPFYDLLKKENRYFSSLGWILPDNHVFLQVHRPDSKPLDVSQMRPDVAEVNRDRVPLAGFTTGRKAPQFRVLHPVFYEGEYLGVVQMGIDARAIIDNLKEKLGLMAGFSVSEDHYRNRVYPSENGLTCSGTVIHSTDNVLLDQVKGQIDWTLDSQRFLLEGRAYNLNKVLPLKDYKDELFGCLFVAMDISGIVAQSKQTFAFAICLGVILLILTWIVLHFSFGSLLDRILRLNESLEQANLELEDRVEERTRAFQAEVEERKHVEERLHSAEKMEAIGLMAGGVAHDLNNILSGLVSYPDLLLMRLSEDSDLKRPIKTIRESGLKAAAVVADLLTVSRNAAQVRSMTNVNTLILEYIQSTDALAVRDRSPGVSFQTDLGSDVVDICCSSAHVSKCIANLAANAAEAMKGSPGTVLFSTRIVRISDEDGKCLTLPAGDYLRLQVRDEGPEISEDDLEHIFEPFYTKKKMGRDVSGIGLSVVWNCVQDHGGAVHTESGEGGTLISLDFPAFQDEDCGNVPTTDEDVDLSGNGKKVLVVDDVPHQRDIALQALEDLGYRAAAVASGEEAVAQIRDEDFDLVLLDMIMEPGMNGDETLCEIKKIRPEQRVVIVSGYSEAEKMKRVFSLGVKERLVKPYTLKQLGRVAYQALLEE